MFRKLIFAWIVSGSLFVVAACVAAFMGSARPYGVDASTAALVRFGAPAIAAAVLVLLSLSFPDLFEPYKPAFPLNVTLPILFCALTFAVVTLVSDTQTVIQKPPDVLQPAALWTNWRVLAIVAAAQMGILTLAVGVEARSARHASTPL